MKTAAALLAATVILLSGGAVAFAAPGDFDSSFDSDGFRAIEFGAGDDRFADLVIQPDGKLVLAGKGTVASAFVLARLTLDGSLDAGFGVSAGRAQITFGLAEGRAIALQRDGKLVTAGRSDGNLAVARVNADGSLDSSFDADGRRTIDFGGDDGASDVLVQPDGKIVVAGTIFNDQFEVMRLTSDGSNDAGWGRGYGNVSIDFGAQDLVSAAALQRDGKIVVAGSSGVANGGYDMAVARLNADGSPDLSFDGIGRRTIDHGGSSTAADVLVQPDGKIVLVGRGGSNELVVTRLTASGSRDSSFGANGTFAIGVGATTSGLSAVAQANGKIVVAGYFSGAGDSQTAIVLRLQPGGSLDTTFGADGVRRINLPRSRATGVELLPDGRIAVAGFTGGDALVALFEGDPPTLGGGPGPGQPGSPGGGGGTSKVPRCAGKRATILGTGKANRLKGTRRADVIVGLGGNDRIDGGRGNDLVCAGAGNDGVKGSIGNDRLYGQNGKDRLDGGKGNDRLAGDAGKDALVGGSGKDRLAGGTGKDNCNGGSGKDRAACEKRRAI